MIYRGDVALNASLSHAGPRDPRTSPPRPVAFFAQTTARTCVPDQGQDDTEGNESKYEDKI